MVDGFTRRRFLQAAGVGAATAGAGLSGLMRAVPARAQGPAAQADLVVYGATAAGVAAAVQYARMGGSVAVVDPGAHVGGMTASGLGRTDTKKVEAIGGLAREFYQRITVAYGAAPSVTSATPMTIHFEPKVAERVLLEMLDEAGITVEFGERLAAVSKQGATITAISTESGRVHTGRMFIDATYEGDLLAGAGVSHTIGREASSQYGESLAGFRLSPGSGYPGVDPYRVPGDPSSGTLASVTPGPYPATGSGDAKLQAYNFRLCLTRAADRVPFPQPGGYDPDLYELLLRYIRAGYRGPFFNALTLPNGKFDSNTSGPMSSNFVTASWGWPEASHDERGRLYEDHRNYHQGLLWFLANDPRVPSTIRSDTALYGLARDEFTDNGNWPHQLYVREARRMVSDEVLRQQHCERKLQASGSVGLGDYDMDCHHVQRIVVDGVVRQEGGFDVRLPGPYGIPYGSVRPRAAECGNLLVPVCFSSSHVAYGSARMEPVFITLGQSAATAAHLAVQEGTTVQGIDVARLQTRLRQDKQNLTWPPPSSDTVIVDNTSSGVVRTGSWTVSRSTPGYYGVDYLHNGNTGRGTKAVRFTPVLPQPGRYEVFARWPATSNRASNVGIVIEHDGGSTTRTVDQRAQGGIWVSLGSYGFDAVREGSVEVTTAGTNGYVIADAVRFVHRP